MTFLRMIFFSSLDYDPFFLLAEKGGELEPAPSLSYGFVSDFF